jgi:hypothetical protein
VKSRLALCALALVAAASLGVATAGAAPKAEPTAKVVGKVKIDKDGTATVKARYICSGDGWHLWVSAKQAEGGVQSDDITQEGGGFMGVPAAWLQRHPTSYRCDGKWHTQKFVIDTAETGIDENGDPFGPVGYGHLVPGQAWVQFCLINEGANVFLLEQSWKKVR